MEIGKEYIYKTEIVGRTKVHEIDSEYKIGIKTAITYNGKDEKEGYHIFKVEELEYKLEQYEDPIVVQITEMTNKICSMYSTLVLGIDKRGEIAKIYNSDELIEKWRDIKSWLINAHPLESYEIIRAKEFELTDMNKEIRSIKYIHFIYQFFFIFGKEPSQGNRNYIKKDEMDRFGAGIVIPVNLMLSIEGGEFKVEGQMIQDDKVVRRLSEFSEVKNLKPEYKISGKYRYNDRVLEYSDFTITEILGENYYSHSYMHTVLDKE